MRHRADDKLCQRYNKIFSYVMSAVFLTLQKMTSDFTASRIISVSSKQVIWAVNEGFSKNDLGLLQQLLFLDHCFLNLHFSFLFDRFSHSLVLQLLYWWNKFPLVLWRKHILHSVDRSDGLATYICYLINRTHKVLSWYSSSWCRLVVNVRFYQTLYYI